MDNKRRTPFVNHLSGLLALGLAGLVAGSPASASDWKMADNPLTTRWAREVSPESVWPEYPRPQLVRSDWLNLNGLWDFSITRKDGPAPSSFTRTILVPFCPESALSGLRAKVEAGDRMWYRRTFAVPKTWGGRRVLLHFGAADWETRVRVNGKEVGMHRGGYMPFSCDITEALQPAKDQELVVSVWDPTRAGGQPLGKQAHAPGTPPGGIIYTRISGIWQTVWLEPVPETHIAALRIVPDADKSSVKVNVIAAGSATNAPVKIAVQDKGRTLAQASGRAGEEITLALPGATLWTPEHPQLYDLTVSLGAGGSADAVSSYCGLRKTSVGPAPKGITRLLLNNTFVLQLGPLDQGYWPDGLYTPPSESALKFDIDVMKRYGFNMVRKHVKVEPDRWYYWCDRMGLLVWQDMPSGANRSPEERTQFEGELREMIDGLYNHPSIVMWVPFNEGWGQYDTPRIVAAVKAQDPSRPVNNASGWTDNHVGDILDVHTYPVPGSPHPSPTRAAVIGEFGGLGYFVPDHQWDKAGWGYATYPSSAALNDAYEELYRVLLAHVDDPGVSAAVYTQLTDVEAEKNGLLTYDREVFKIDLGAAAAHRGLLAPRIDGAPLFVGHADISIKATAPSTTIRYTLDGSDPTAASPAYSAPLRIEKAVTVKARAFTADGSASRISVLESAPGNALKGSPAPADSATGIAAAYYEVKPGIRALPDFATLTPNQQIVLDSITTQFPRRNDNYAVRYSGWLRVPTTGAYRLICASDDGSRLMLDGQRLLDNDGIHGTKEAAQWVVLEAGDHALEVQYFQGAGGQELTLSLEGPGLTRRPLSKEYLRCIPQPEAPVKTP